jgi:3-oxoacyl-[acyl-carrier protein] reductase
MGNYLEQAFGLKGRRALVTGGSRGIGRAVCEALAGAGAEVLVHYRSSEAAAQEVVQAIESAGGIAGTVHADLGDSAQANFMIAEAQARWGALDILVNNAGDLVQRSRIAEFSDELIEEVLRTNIHTALFSTRAAIPLLEKGNDPIIINLSSVAAHNGGANGATLYAATKGAIHTFTRGLAKELAPRIRVNALAPGVALTDFHRKHSTDEGLEKIAQGTPLQRLGAPEDHGAAAVFLCGKGASYITGEVVEINGGLWLA